MTDFAGIVAALPDDALRQLADRAGLGVSEDLADTIRAAGSGAVQNTLTQGAGGETGVVLEWGTAGWRLSAAFDLWLMENLPPA